MENKRLSINLIANILSYVISTALSFVITPFLVKYLGKEVYGFYGIANNFVNYITVISVALNSMAAKYITVEIVRGNEYKARQYFTSIFFSNVVLCFILTPILVIIVFKLNFILSISKSYLVDVQILFALIFAAMLLRFITSIYGCATYASNRIDLRAYTEMAKSILRLGLYVLIFTIFKPSIVYVGIIMLLLEIFNSVAQIILSKKLIPNMRISKAYNNIKLVVNTLKIGIWNSLNQLGDLLLSSSDLIAANMLLGEVASGNISIIKTISSLISGVITAINGVFMPRVAHRYAEGNRKKLVSEVQMSQRIMGAIVTPIVILLIVFGYDFYSLWVPGNNIKLLMKLSSLDVSRMAIIGVVWPVSNLNIVLDKVKIPSLLVIFSGTLNIISMILLVKTTKLGIYSIVITTLILTILFYGIFIPIYPCKTLKISSKLFFKPVVQMCIASILITSITLLLHKIFTINSWLEFFIYGGICAIIAYFISIAVFIGPKNIKVYINYFREKV